MMDAEQDLLNLAPCGIFSFTEDGVITGANAYMHNLLEYADGELIGTNIANLLSISGRIFYQTHFYPLVKLHHHTEEIFLNLQSKNKNDKPVVLNAVTRMVNEVPEILCSFIPVLNRRKYEDEILLAKKTAEDAMQKNEALEKVKQELKLQQRAMDRQLTLLKFQHKELLQLNDIITHDMQEPLRKLMLFSNELQADRINAEVKSHGLSVIHKSSEKIKSILHNLQVYLGLSASVPYTEKVDLTLLLQGELYQLERCYNHIDVQANIDSLPTITGNKQQLGKLFYYLLKNAFDHGTTGHNLVLNVGAVIIKENVFNSMENRYKYVDHVRLSIEDKGPGFDGRFNDYIFGVLKRLDMTGVTAGFGLAFCRRIVENHFGDIKAAGMPGKGAVFTVTLPIHLFSS